jgi:hypothetical protein
MKFYLTCILVFTDAVLAVLPRKPSLPYVYAQLLGLRTDAALLRSALMSIRLAAQLNGRREINAEILQDEIIFWTAYELAFRMNSMGGEHKLLSRCLFRIAREGEIVLLVSWLNGWRSGIHEAECERAVRDAAGDSPGYADAPELHDAR